MNKTDIVDIMNLLDGAMNMKKTYEATIEDTKKKVEAIRQFAIDALEDYNDVCHNLTDMLNHYRALYETPCIYPDTSLFENCYGCFNHLNKGYTYTDGIFYLNNKDCSRSIGVFCNNIVGHMTPNGYSGENRVESYKDWVATNVSIADDTVSKMCKDDLITGFFTVKDSNKKEHYTTESLKKYNWSLEGWLEIKRRAELTRKRTKEIVRLFKESIVYRTEIIKKDTNHLEKEAVVSTYVKVTF